MTSCACPTASVGAGETSRRRKVKVDSRGRRGAQVDEPPWCCKPLSATRDKDKLLVSPLAEEDEMSGGCSFPGIPILSRERQKKEKTNGWNSANNCPTTLLKYLPPSVSFFFTVVSLACSNWHDYYYSLCSSCMQRVRFRGGMKSGERLHKNKWSSGVLLLSFLLVILLAELIQVSTASPIPSILVRSSSHTVSDGPASTKKAHNNEEHSQRYYERGESHAQGGGPWIMLKDNPQPATDYQGHNFKANASVAPYSRGHEDEKDDVHKRAGGGHDTRRSHLKFPFPSAQLHSNNNKGDNEQQEHAMSHLQHAHHQAVKMTPLAMRMKQPHSAEQETHAPQRGAGEVTNDLPHRRQNISNNNVDDGERSGSFLKNSINDDDNEEGRRSNSISAPDTLGSCWYVASEEDDEDEELSSSSSSLVSSAETRPTQKVISVLCNGTSHLALSLSQIPDNFVPFVNSITVRDSVISTLDLSLFHRYPQLESLSVTHSNVTHITGTCPTSLKALNISFNALRKLDSTVFPGWEVEQAYDNKDEEKESINDADNIMKVKGKNNGIDEIEGPLIASSILQNQNKTNSTGPTLASDPKPSIPSRFHTGSHYHEKSSRISSRSRKASSSSPFHPTSREALSAASQLTEQDKSEDQLNNNDRRRDRPKEVQVEQALVEVEDRNNEGRNDDDEDTPLVEDNNSLRKRNKKGNGGSRFAPAAALSCTTGDCTFESIRASDREDGEEKYENNAQLSQRSTNLGENKGESYSSFEDEQVESESGDYDEEQRGASSSPAITATGRIIATSREDGDGETRGKVEVSNMSEEESRSAKRMTSSLQDIDLSHNKISEIPKAVLHLKNLKSLRLSGNELKCDFVWEKLADWYMKSDDPNVLKDGDDTFCGVVDDVRVFQFTVLGVLKAKKDVVETCRTVDKTICHECGLYSLNKQPGHGYNLSHHSPHGNVAVALKLDCSNRNLTELPEVPPQTWQLNVSGNFIKDLSPLKDAMYENLLILDADANEISSLDGLTGTSFLDRYNYLSLQNNRFPVIPSNILSSLKNMRGQGVTFLGANFVECDCDVVKEIKPLLLENSKKLKDLKEIYCKNMKTSTGDTFMSVKDLQYTDLCYMDTEESNEVYLYLVIIIELLLIIVIVAKVWHDQRTFRRTGILPWCSAKMPRLPCDAMLESVKEPPHFNRSSSTNVRSFACEPPTQSISSNVHLREVRSNSGQSEKSSQISQLSSFPSSSRTSSV